MNDSKDTPCIEKKGYLFVCYVCDITLNSMNQVRSHIKGSKHQKSVLSKISSSEVKEISVTARKNEGNTCSLSSFKKYKGHGVYECDTLNPNQYKCIFCDVPLNSEKQVMSHISGAKHAKNQ